MRCSGPGGAGGAGLLERDSSLGSRVNDSSTPSTLESDRVSCSDD